MYALGLTQIGESVAKGSIAYLDNATLRDVEVKESHIEAAQRTAEGLRGNTEQRLQGMLGKSLQGLRLWAHM